jgi:alginate O-acetyltransferase complex protein AlgI
VLERSGVINAEEYAPWKKHVYTLSVVIIGWVFFRAGTLVSAFVYIKSLIGFSTGANFSPLTPVNMYTIAILIIAIIFAAPVRLWLAGKISEMKIPVNFELTGQCILYLLIFLWCIDELAQTSYNPFIYFRF